MSYIKDAFDTVCKQSQPVQEYYVCLMEKEQYYGGPEEGGWWGTNVYVVAYQKFLILSEAEKAVEAIETLAQELQEESQKVYGKQCLREMKWLDDRGLDADYLPEPDGPSEFYVLLSEGFPEESRGPTHYE